MKRKINFLVAFAMLLLMWANAPIKIKAATFSVGTDADLHTAINSAVDGDVIEITANITLESPIRYWTKNLTIKSGAGGPYTITRASSGWPLATDAVRPGGYYPSMIEVDVNPADCSVSSGLLLEDIIIDDANNPEGIAYEGTISAYNACITVTLGSGAVLTNNGGNRGVVFLENGAEFIMDPGSEIKDWLGGDETFSTAIYNFKGKATINGTIANNTIPKGSIAYVFGGELTVGPNANITNNTFIGGNLIQMKDTGSADGGEKDAIVTIEGPIKNNTADYGIHDLLNTGSDWEEVRLTIKNGGELSDNHLGVAVIWITGSMKVENGGKVNNNEGIGALASTTVSGITVEKWTDTLDYVIRPLGVDDKLTIDIDGEMNGNKANYFYTFISGGGVTFNVNPTGKVNNNFGYQPYGVFYSANAGTNHINIYGEVSGNINKGYSCTSVLGISICSLSGQGVFYDQQGDIEIFNGAKLNDNKTGMCGGVFKLTLSSQLVMHGGEMKGNDSSIGSIAITKGVEDQSYNNVGGGAVQVSEAAKFIMEDGEISGNKAYIGGGVIVTGTNNTQFVMLGGTIKDNTQTASAISPAGSKWGSDIAILAGSDTSSLTGGHYVEIAPTAVVGSGWIGMQNQTPAYNSTGTSAHKLNQAYILPASRSETLYFGVLDQFTASTNGTDKIVSLIDAVTNTTTGYAGTKPLNSYEISKLTYKGNIWIAADTTSALNVSLNYPDDIAVANRPGYVYVVSYRALDDSGNIIAGKDPVVLTTNSGEGLTAGSSSLDFTIPYDASVKSYGIVKYCYPITQVLTVTVTHEQASWGTFVYINSGGSYPGLTANTDTSFQVIYDKGVNKFYYSVDPSKEFTGLTLKATPDTNYGVELATASLKDASSVTVGSAQTLSGLSNTYLTTSALSVLKPLIDDTTVELNFHAKFNTPHYEVHTFLQNSDSTWPTSASSVDSIAASAGTVITITTPSPVTGYTWDSGHSGEVLSGTVIAVGDSGYPLKLYVYYKLNSYEVAYDLNGGDISGATTIANKTGVHYTDSGLLPSGSLTAPYGKVFDHWELTEISYPSASSDTLTLGDQTVTSSSVAGDLIDDWGTDTDGLIFHLKAYYTDAIVYLHYDLNDGGSGTALINGGNATDTVAIGSLITSAPSYSSQDVGGANAPTRSGYTFDGWYLDSSCTTAVTSSDTMPATDTTIYAGWTAIPALITITFDKNIPSGATDGVTAVPATETITAGSSFAILPSHAPTGAPYNSNGNYIFSGWGTSPSGAAVFKAVAYSSDGGISLSAMDKVILGTIYVLGDSIPSINSSITLYAIWTPPAAPATPVQPATPMATGVTDTVPVYSAMMLLAGVLALMLVLNKRQQTH